jgi:acetolactate synthase-1/2/3 large subunit
VAALDERSSAGRPAARADHPVSSRRTADLADEIAAGAWQRDPFEDAAAAGRLDPRTLTLALDAMLRLERTVVVDSGHFMAGPDRPLVLDARVDPDIRADWLEEAFRGH